MPFTLIGYEKNQDTNGNNFIENEAEEGEKKIKEVTEYDEV